MAALDRPVAKPRPVYLNLFAIRQPLPAVVSFLHRVSGALLFLIGIPLLLWVSAARARLAGRLGANARGARASRSPSSRCWCSPGPISITFWLASAISLMDLHIGMDLPAARRSGAFALVLAVVLTFAVAVKLW